MGCSGTESSNGVSIPDSGFARSGSVRGITASRRFNLTSPDRRHETCRSDAISVPGWTKRRAARVLTQVYQISRHELFRLDEFSYFFSFFTSLLLVCFFASFARFAVHEFFRREHSNETCMFEFAASPRWASVAKPTPFTAPACPAPHESPPAPGPRLARTAARNSSPGKRLLPE